MSNDATNSSSSHFPPLAPIPTVAAAGVCTRCGAPLKGSYHLIDETVACAKCRYAAEAEHASGGFGRAFMYGIGAAIVGAIGYYLFVTATGMEWGLITALVGIGVGQAVRIGSRSRGGRKFQFLALVLAYLAMGGAYLPIGAKEFMKGWEESAASRKAQGLSSTKASTSPAAEEQVAPGEPTSDSAAGASDDGVASEEPATAPPTPATKKVEPPKAGAGMILLGLAVILLGGIVALFAMPILVAVSSPLSGLIMAFALIRAWRQNAGEPTQLRVAGPFRIGAPQIAR
ncbi:MAG TPA: hypothetical protein VHM30_06985 [Gemmatimonadaceae bacterium]|nr:hypothetical protein [Gemmatimonadaceae bacterium]